MTLVGHSVSTLWGGSDREEARWIGQPWRRLELLTHRWYYQGVEVDRSRDLTLHVGLRRLGLAFTVIVSRASVLDYSDEPNQ